MRRHAFTMLVIAGIGLLSGCAAQMSKSIEQRVDVSEQCRQVQEDQLPSTDTNPHNILSAHLGNFGSCDVAWLDTENKKYEFLPLCSFAQIQSKYDYEFSTAPAKPHKDKILTSYKKVVAALAKLKITLDSSQDKIQTSLKTKKEKRLLVTTEAINGIDLPAIRGNLAELRKALNELRLELKAGSEAISQQAATEFSAWDTNFRAMLDQFDRLLSGDYRIVVSDTLRNQVMVHSARRSLELLHSALRPADAIINKLDQQGYGVISVGYMAFGPNIQDAVDDAKLKIEGIYAARLERANQNSKIKVSTQEYMQQFMWEMRRAACANLQQGTQFSMLTEIVDTLLIRKIPDQDKNKTIIRKKLQAYAPTPRGTRELTGSFVEAYPLMVEAADPANSASGGKAGQTDQQASVALHVSLANEWAARQMLLVEKMDARVKASARPERDKEGRELPQKIIFPPLEQVDEAVVTQIADTASARVIDDATRSAPELLINQTTDKGDNLRLAIANNINVSAAAYAVSQASATINASFNVSNTFNPTNTVAPIINVAPYPATGPGTSPEVPESFCASSYFSNKEAACMRDGGSYVVTFSTSRYFESEACSSKSIEAELIDLAKAASEFANKNGTRFSAAITGYASPLAATPKNCGYQLAPRCTYVNQIRSAIKIEGCRPAPGKDDGNRMLSAARADFAARTLEQAARGTILVKALSAQGADSAYGAAHENLDLDRTVVVRLQAAR